MPTIHKKQPAFVQAQEKIQEIFSENEQSALEILEQLSHFQSVAETDENSPDLPTDKSLMEAVVDSVLNLNKVSIDRPELHPFACSEKLCV